MLTFQEVILRLQRYWADQGALIWQPYSEKVGAGTMNPATILRVLGPEPWNVAYVDPSYRPDDGRYGDNPNRMQMFYQYQVILKPDPGDSQERYLRSLEALGIRREEHDIRFVEDNWESPALGAWGLGWEVWLDGLEITQFTYFQQAAGLVLPMPAVEITYGLERIVKFLQDVRSVWEIDWDGQHTYGEIFKDQEIDYCRYQFELADVGRLQELYRLFEAEAVAGLEAGLAVPALDYILRCSHTFNVLDARGAVGVTERARFFKRMRALARRAADSYLNQRDRAGNPWLNRPGLRAEPVSHGTPMFLPLHTPDQAAPEAAAGTAPFLFEIGVEELPAADVSEAIAQLQTNVPASLDSVRLAHGPVHVWGTPRRLVVLVESLALAQPDREQTVKGPAARAAFDAEGRPTKAAEGFARSQGVPVESLKVEEMSGGQYVMAVRQEKGRPAVNVLSEILSSWISGLKFGRTMRWNETGVAFSRPLRWILALLDDTVVPFGYAGLTSGRVTRGSRPAGSPEVALSEAANYGPTMAAFGVWVDPAARQAEILRQVKELAAGVNGQIPEDVAGLLEEVANLVETPTAMLGTFDARYLALPPEVLVAVMKKHQRYFPVFDAEGKIKPYFIAVRNGGRESLDKVVQGNADVLGARYADAEYFYQRDLQQKLEEFLPRLATLTFQEALGSMRDKSERLEKLVPWLGEQLGLNGDEPKLLAQAAHLSKADLATQMVVEMTSLQGIMGGYYARHSGQPEAVAAAIREQYQFPKSRIGMGVVLADRLDSLAGLFAVGLAPTGSADPYGLRRSAAMLVQVLLTYQLPFSVQAGLKKAAELLPVQATPESQLAALDFVIGRLRVALRDEGFAFDVVEAALATRGDDPYAARQAAAQLTAWVAKPEWSNWLANYARCVRITRDQARFSLDPELLKEPSEKALYAALQTAEGELQRTSDVDALLAALVPLVPVIERFFVDVLVMDPDAEVRQARLALLQRIAGLADGIVDLSKLEGF